MNYVPGTAINTWLVACRSGHEDKRLKIQEGISLTEILLLTVIGVLELRSKKKRQI